MKKMTYQIFVLSMIFILSSNSMQAQKYNDDYAKGFPEVIGTIDNNGRTTITADLELLKKVFESYYFDKATITGVEIVRQEDNSYSLNGVGYSNDELKNSRNVKTNIGIGKDGATFMIVGGTTESCNGNPCSHCSFARGGGCDCNDTSRPDGHCDHSITVGPGIGGY